MKSWRKQAAAVKLAVIADGKHEHGARYGKLIRDSQKATFKDTFPSLLLQRLLLRVGLIKQDGQTA